MPSAAQSRSIQAGTWPEIEAVFASLTEHQVGGVTFSDPVFYILRRQIAALAARYAIPAVSDFREFVDAGGLASYGANLRALYRQFGLYTGKVLDGMSQVLGEVKSLQYSGSGAFFSFGQSFTPGDPWPRFGLKSYTRTIDYETPALRDEVVRPEGDPVARGGGLPIPGGQRLTTAVSGTLAWSQLGEGPVNPAPAAVGDRVHQLWITPQGVIQGARKYNATVQAQQEGGKKKTTIAFTVPGQFKVRAMVNDENLVEKVESGNTNPVLGDTLTETVYADYKDVGGVRFPTRITQKQGGFPTLDLTISKVIANPPADIQSPDNVRQASIKVQADKVADGVWYLTGGTHHSVLVEMSDHLVVIEGPQDDARATAVIAEVKNLVPNKPIKYVVNSHHHFDHAGGLGAFAAEGATIITYDSNKAFLEQSLASPRAIHPDKLVLSGKKATVEGMADKRVLRDGTRSVELYRIQGNTHADGLIMAYLPKEKLLVEADLYTPAPANTAPPAPPNPASVNLYDNIERLNLAVDQILPLHGRKVPLADLQKWIGKGRKPKQRQHQKLKSGRRESGNHFIVARYKGAPLAGVFTHHGRFLDAHIRTIAHRHPGTEHPRPCSTANLAPAAAAVDRHAC